MTKFNSLTQQIKRFNKQAQTKIKEIQTKQTKIISKLSSVVDENRAETLRKKITSLNQ